MKFTKFTLFTLAAILVMASTSLAAGSTFKADCSGYDVALVNLANPVTINNQAGDPVTYKQAYLVRLFGSFPVNRALVMQIEIGTEKIRSFAGYSGGVYFYVFEKSQLDKMAGRQIRAGFSKEKKTTLIQSFDPEKFAPFEAVDEIKALLKK